MSKLIILKLLPCSRLSICTQSWQLVAEIWINIVIYNPKFEDLFKWGYFSHYFGHVHQCCLKNFATQPGPSQVAFEYRRSRGTIQTFYRVHILVPLRTANLHLKSKDHKTSRNWTSKQTKTGTFLQVSRVASVCSTFAFSFACGTTGITSIKKNHILRLTKDDNMTKYSIPCWCQSLHRSHHWLNAKIFRFNNRSTIF